jgi:hypothetical protein
VDWHKGCPSAGAADRLCAFALGIVSGEDAGYAYGVLCGFVAVGVLLVAPQVGALTISGVTITLAGTNTADDGAPGGSGSNNTSETSILSPGGSVADAVDASVSAETRYASNLWADASITGVNGITTNSYDLSLSISADPGTVYDVVIGTLFQGLLTRVNDSFFGESQASVSAVEVILNSVVSVPHATSAQLLALGFYDASLGFSESGTNSLTGQTGTTNLNFNVTWTSSADNTEGDEAGVLIGLDEAGRTPSLPDVGGVTAGEYGILSPSRNENLDGHFIEVTAKVTSVNIVPEPSTALLLTLGVAGLAARRRCS